MGDNWTIDDLGLGEAHLQLGIQLCRKLNQIVWKARFMEAYLLQRGGNQLYDSTSKELVKTFI